MINPVPAWNRRHILKMGASLSGGLLVATSFGNPIRLAAEQETVPSETARRQIEEILNAKGNVSDGVFHIDIDRKDMDSVTLRGIPIKPSFQINGAIFFQSIGAERVMMNADLAVKPDELDRFIDRLLTHDVVFQAEHQHMFDFSPMVWFVHFRAEGDPRHIAEGVRDALDATSTPLPQKPAEHATTPLPAEEMGRILGAKPEVKEDGVVTFDIPRRERILLGGIEISPYLNVDTDVAFQPLEGGRAAAVPDYSLLPSEIQRVVGQKLHEGWEIGCLYNQETAESPQLYFSHQFRTGDPLQLAREIRGALNLMNVKLES
jgi:hypothetical protein